MTKLENIPMPPGMPDWDNVYAPSSYAVINRVLRRIGDIGGTDLGFKHSNRPTDFEVETSKGTSYLRRELCTCDERATFTLPLRMAKDELHVEGCVVCDAADRWPRLKL